MARAKKKATSVKVNFKGVESRQTPPEGDYKLEVIECVSDTGPSGDMIVFTLEIAEGKYKGQKVWFYCPLAENSLWKLHAFLTALGEEVPEDELDIDLGDLVGKEVVGVLTHETYQGKKKAKMTDFASLEDYEGDLAGGDDEDDDEDDKKSSKKSKAKKGVKSKASDDDDDDEDDKPKSKKKASKKDADDEDDEDEKPAKKSKSKKSSKDDDDDEDEKPAKGKKGAKESKKKAKKYTTAEIEDMDEEELQELLEKHDLEDEVDLDDYKKLPKKVAAVIDALEDADLIEDDD